jgi:hypothetical protein
VSGQKAGARRRLKSAKSHNSTKDFFAIRKMPTFVLGLNVFFFFILQHENMNFTLKIEGRTLLSFFA